MKVAYEFEDLDPEVQEKVRDDAIEVQIWNQMEAIMDQFQKGWITEEGLIEIFGMGSEDMEEYPDQAWLAHKCYEHFKEGIEECAEVNYIKGCLFTSDGKRIMEDAIPIKTIFQIALSEGKEIKDGGLG